MPRPTTLHLRRLHLQRHRRCLCRHMNQRGSFGEHDVYDSASVVTAGHREHFASWPYAEEATDLVRQYDDAEQRGHDHCAEEFGVASCGGRSRAHCHARRSRLAAGRDLPAMGASRPASASAANRCASAEYRTRILKRHRARRRAALRCANSACRLRAGCFVRCRQVPSVL